MNMVASVLPILVNHTDASVYPAETQYGGVYGDNEVLTLVFSPLDEAYHYQIEVVDGGGCYDITELLSAQNGELRYAVPAAWTAPGTAAVRLIAVGEGEEPTLRHYAPLRLRFSDREQGTAMGEMLPRWQTVMAASVEATRQASASAYEAEIAALTAREAAEAARQAKGDKGDKGDPGPAGPQGPKGEKGDPGEGGGTNVVQVTITESVSSHTPTQMKAVLDAGGILVFNDGYCLYNLQADDGVAYCCKSEMTYGGQLIFKDVSVWEDGTVATYTEQHDLGHIETALDNILAIQQYLMGGESQ